MNWQMPGYILVCTMYFTWTISTFWLPRDLSVIVARGNLSAERFNCQSPERGTQEVVSPCTRITTVRWFVLMCGISCDELHSGAAQSRIRCMGFLWGCSTSASSSGATRTCSNLRAKEGELSSAKVPTTDSGHLLFRREDRHQVSLPTDWQGSTGHPWCGWGWRAADLS